MRWGVRELQWLAAALIAFSVAGADDTMAEQRWAPTVSTTAQQDVAERVATPVMLPRWANPQVLNAKAWTASTQQAAPPAAAASAPVAPIVPQVQPVPPPPATNLWSNIVTGALPDAPQEPKEALRSAPMAASGALPVPATAAAAAASTDRRVAEAAPAHSPAAPAPAKAASTAAEHGPAAGHGEGKAAVGASAGAVAGGDAEKKAVELPAGATPAQQYCFNTAESAADARYASQAKQIKAMEAELDKRVVLLQQKTEEYKAWLAKRDEFSRKAHDKLVGFYAKMKPDAAAQQMMAMDEEAAAALLMKLESKAASLVLAEIEPARAAKITAIISGAGKVSERRAKAPAAAGQPRAQAEPPKPPQGVGAAPTSAPTSTPSAAPDANAAKPQTRS